MRQMERDGVAAEGALFARLNEKTEQALETLCGSILEDVENLARYGRVTDRFAAARARGSNSMADEVRQRGREPSDVRQKVNRGGVNGPVVVPGAVRVEDHPQASGNARTAALRRVYE